MVARRIVIPGGNGQVGTMLASYFHARGDAVTVLARRPAENRVWGLVQFPPVQPQRVRL